MQLGRLAWLQCVKGGLPRPLLSMRSSCLEITALSGDEGGWPLARGLGLAQAAEHEDGDHREQRDDDRERRQVLAPLAGDQVAPLRP